MLLIIIRYYSTACYTAAANKNESLLEMKTEKWKRGGKRLYENDIIKRISAF